MRALLVTVRGAGLLSLTVIPHALACTITQFDSTYDIYPDCARNCLACKDPDYVNNFGNNCDYASGECCTSQYHNAIAETWACVRNHCGEKLSKDAYQEFEKQCKDKGKGVKEEDTPSGYGGNSSSSGHGSKLSKGQIAGICVGVIAALISIVASVIRIKHYVRKKKQTHATDGGELALVHGGSQRPYDLTTIASAIRSSDGPIRATFNRNTSTSSFFGGVTVTEETLEITRDAGRGISTSHYSMGRVVEEEPD